MIPVDTSRPWRFVRQNPLVPASVAFLLGVAAAPSSSTASAVFLSCAITAWLVWIIIERGLHVSAISAGMLLLGAFFFAGLTVWQLNQQYGQPRELVRFAPADGEVPVTLRARVLVPPTPGDHHGNAYWAAQVTEIFTNDGWQPASGSAAVKWRTNAAALTLARGDLVEMDGWLSRPPPALNPGTLDLRQRLAADRVFTQVRIPRVSGIVRVADGGGGTQADILTRIRLDLRAKLLVHTLPLDPGAANTLVALVLGYRDPSMDDISRSFADAGVGHLLAISGSHVVFFAGVVWLLLRLIPMRPRWREPIIAMVVLAYVAATPCGPPVMRAAIGVGMVLISRMLGRPRAYMNMLAAAAVLIVILRPTDLFDAGFQLTFLCTAALLLLMPRVHQGLFGRFLERQQLLSSLAQTRWSRWRFQIIRFITLAVVANGIGALVSMPLVMHHFNQINLYGIAAGIIAFPAVAASMTAGLVQLASEWLSTGAGSLFAPLSTHLAHFTVGLIGWLAAIPGAAIGVRSPPAWLVAILYVPVALWAMRPWLGAKRALIVNGFVAAICCAVAWFGTTAPVGALRLQVLDVGQGSCVVMTTPGGRTWVVNAGSRDLPDPMRSALAPALRVAGVRRAGGMLLTSVDAVHASMAGSVVERFRPPVVFAPNSDDREWTLAADRLAAANAPVKQVQAGDRIDDVVRILWAQPSLVVMLEFAGKRVLLVDASGVEALALLPLNGVEVHCDAVIVVSPERGVADAALRRLLEETGARTVVWSGRGAWAPREEATGEWNAAEGCVEVRVGGDGEFIVGPFAQVEAKGS